VDLALGKGWYSDATSCLCAVSWVLGSRHRGMSPWHLTHSLSRVISAHGTRVSWVWGPALGKELFADQMMPRALCRDALIKLSPESKSASARQMHGFLWCTVIRSNLLLLLMKCNNKDYVWHTLVEMSPMISLFVTDVISSDHHIYIYTQPN
jgi:hypothetical protein